MKENPEENPTVKGVVVAFTVQYEPIDSEGKEQKLQLFSRRVRRPGFPSCV
jgi:hypothetical protein